MNNGIIIEKWARGNYPLDSLDEIFAQDPEILTAQAQIREHLFAEIALFVILCLIMIIRFFSKIFYRKSLIKLYTANPKDSESVQAECPSGSESALDDK